MQTRPWTILLLLLALLAVAGCSSSDSGDDAKPSEWPMLAQNQSSTYSNPGETKLSPSNVAQLKLAWQFTPADTVNGAVAVVGGVVYMLSGAAGYAIDA